MEGGAVARFGVTLPCVVRPVCGADVPATRCLTGALAGVSGTAADVGGTSPVEPLSLGLLASELLGLGAGTAATGIAGAGAAGAGAAVGVTAATGGTAAGRLGPWCAVMNTTEATPPARNTTPAAANWTNLRDLAGGHGTSADSTSRGMPAGDGSFHDSGWTGAETSDPANRETPTGAETGIFGSMSALGR